MREHQYSLCWLSWRRKWPQGAACSRFFFFFSCITLCTRQRTFCHFEYFCILWVPPALTAPGRDYDTWRERGPGDFEAGSDMIFFYVDKKQSLVWPASTCCEMWKETFIFWDTVQDLFRTFLCKQLVVQSTVPPVNVFSRCFHQYFAFYCGNLSPCDSDINCHTALSLKNGIVLPVQ